MKTYRLPPAFYWDHTYRDLPAGRVVRETKAHVYVELDGETWDELRSDAIHYAYAMVSAGFDGGFGLASSARATLKVLDKIGRP